VFRLIVHQAVREEILSLIRLALKRQQEMLDEQEQAGLTRAQVAERMGVSAPTVSRMEANITRASLDTLTRYALVCGVKHPQITLY